ncbi:MAG: Gfo/Idh/MocA family oxidoreductase, partial [Planctomycetota bacterium]
MSDKLRVGVIGLGFMGATHCAAYRQASGLCELVAVCDPKASRRGGQLGDVGGNLDGGQATAAFDAGQVHGYETPAELLADGDIDLVSICTRTDTHVELACAAMHAGKHVLVEKPVALTTADVQKVADVA